MLPGNGVRTAEVLRKTYNNETKELFEVFGDLRLSLFMKVI